MDGNDVGHLNPQEIKFNEGKGKEDGIKTHYDRYRNRLKELISFSCKIETQAH